MATDSIAIVKAIFPANAQKAGLTDPRIQAELKTGFIEQYSGSNPSDCSQAGPINAASYADSGQGLLGDLTRPSTTSAKISSSIDTVLKAIPVVGDFLSQAFNAINPFRAHAQAVAREQGTLCTLIPQVNQVLAQTDAEVKSGSLSADEGRAQLENMVAGFNQQTQPIYKDCNASCVMRAVVKAEATIHEQGYRNSPLYYLKKYWWVGAIFLAVFLFRGRN